MQCQFSSHVSQIPDTVWTYHKVAVVFLRGIYILLDLPVQLPVLHLGLLPVLAVLAGVGMVLLLLSVSPLLSPPTWCSCGGSHQ